MIKNTAIVFLLALWATQAIAINKCTGPDGAISYQDLPCSRKGVEIKVVPSRAPRVAPSTEPAQSYYELIKGERIRREKWSVMNDARLAMDFARRQCDAEQRKLAASKDISKNNLAGATRDASISQEMAAAAQICDTRIRSLEKLVTDAEQVCQEIKCIPLF